MKTEITAFDLAFLTKALQTLIGERLEKIYILEDRGLLLTIGKKFVQAAPGKLWTPITKPETPDQIHPFAAHLRKKIGNSKITKIEQVCSERILAIHVMRSETPYVLYLELFARGNVVLCDKDTIVISSLTKGPRIQPNRAYVLPKSIDTFHLDENYFVEDFMESKENASKTLAVEFGLGKVLAEELCLRCGLPTDATKSEDRAHELHQALRKMLGQKPSPQLVSDKGILIDATPVPFQSYANKKRENIDNFGQALARIFEIPATAAKEQKLAPVQKQLQKIDTMIAIQEKSLTGLESKAAEERKKGEYMYEHYQEINQLLTEITEAKKKMSWKEVKAKFKQIKEINEATGDIIVEI